MIRRILRGIVATLAWLSAAVLFTLSPAIGSISSIAAVALALLLSPTALLPGSWTRLRAQPAMLIFLASFISLTICYAATADQPTDVLFAADFLGLPLASVAYLLAVRRAGERSALIVSALMVLGAAVGAATGTYDVFIDHKARAIGWAQGGNLMARTVVLIGFLAAAGVFATRARWRWWFLLGPALALYALYLTGTRGVFVAVPLLGLILIWALLRDIGAPRWWYGAGAAVLVAIVAIGVALSPRFLGVGPILEKIVIDPASISDQATSQRLYMWTAGWATFLKSPVIGFGWANFTEASKPYGIYMFHNDFFDMAVAAGGVGIGCWIAILAAPLIGALWMPHDRFHTARFYCALILSTSLFVFGLTDMTLGYDLPTTLYGFGTAVVLGAFRSGEADLAARA